MKDFPYLSQKKSSRIVRRKAESEGKSSVKLVLALIGLVLVALFFVRQRVEYIRTERHVRKLLLEKRKIESTILPLKLEERYLTQYDKIKKIASQELKLQEAHKSQIIEVEVENGEEETE